MTDETVTPNLAAIVDKAINKGLAATEPAPVGDFGEARVVPMGAAVQIDDVRRFEAKPRTRKGEWAFVDVDSTVNYVQRYMTDNTLVYAVDPHGDGEKMLRRRQTSLIEVMIDDHPTDDTSAREHKATMVLRSTEAANRWGNALEGSLSQEQFLDLIVDGLGEIADPPGADLRDLVSDLHAIRTAEVESVIRTGGEGAIKVTENVKLHAGPGTEVKFPESMTVVFQPFVDTEDTATLELRIRPNVLGSKVSFNLSCAGLDNALATIAYRVAQAFGTAVDREVMWTA